MKVKSQIKSYFTGSVLFEYEKEGITIKDVLVEAVKQGANLQGADLRGANLQDANLRGANLWGANLQGANLQNADLWGADLQDADLWGADLRGVNLRGADLQDADLRGANLRGVNLRGAKNIKNYYRSDIDILKLQTGKLIAFKYLDKNFNSPINSVKLEYKIGETIEENNFNSDEKEDCGSGLNVATLGWCLRETDANLEKYVYVKVEFDVSDIVAIPYFSDGKFRVKKLKVLEQLTKKELEDYCKEII